MPKSSLYACKRAAFTALVLALLIAGRTARAGAQPAEASPCAACVLVTAAPGQAILMTGPLNGLEVLLRTAGAEPGAIAAAAASIAAAGGRPGLFVDTRAVPAAMPMAASARRIVIHVAAPEDPDALAFLLKTRITELRAAAAEVAVGIAASREMLDLLLARQIAPYVDFLATPAPAEGPQFPRTVAALTPRWRLQPAAPAGGASFRRWLVTLPQDALLARDVVRDLARAAPLVGEGLIPGGMVDVRCGSERLPTHLDPESLATIAIASRGCPDREIAIVPDASGVERIVLSAGEAIVRVPAAEGRFAEGVRVVGARSLSAREIIARHQAAAARQRRAIRHLISTGHMTLTFEAPGFPAPMAISSQAVIYNAPDRVEIEQRDIRINGIAFSARGVPRLPLLEPERVASPPLAITLTDVYRYSLAGEETVAGVACHVLEFEPIDDGRTLYAGRVWIARDGFAMVKISARQTGLRGSIVSSEQTDEFRAEAGAFWLLARSEVRQIYEGPGHRTPIHRLLVIERHEINPPGFEARRASAYASPSIMLRDTAEGFRYLKRDKPDTAAGVVAAPVVAGPATRVRTVAIGAIVDPNISRPLPFAGLSYVDFDLFGTGTQFNGFFGGVYGQLAVSIPSLAGSRWQLAGRAFGIASSYNDRAFVNGRETYDANITQRPGHASIWLLRPLTARLTLRAGYDFDYTGFGRADSTGPAFVVPAAQAAHGMRLALEGQRNGWAASVWWSGTRRAGWRAWGYGAAAAPGVPGEYAPAHHDFQRMGAVVSRTFIASPRLVGRVEGSWMAGRDLDRFSRYTFGSFDNRLRGYPSALIRYDRGGVLRASAAWAAAPRLRIDAFLDSAYVRDPGFGPRPKSYTGAGAAAEIPAPFGTLLAVEWGYGFQGINADGGRGTQVLRISGYKMF